MVATKAAPDDVAKAARALGTHLLSAYPVPLAPTKTPDDIIKKLNAATLKVLALPEVKERIAQSGSEPAGTTPAEFGAEIKAALERMKNTVKTQGITFDPSGS